MRWPYSWPIAGTSDNETERTTWARASTTASARAKIPRFGSRALLERAGAWELLGNLSGGS